MKSIAFLSHKGGVGKTSIALNVGVALAQKGNRICLLDNDFFGPSLSTFITPSVKWLNEYLTQKLAPEEFLQEVSCRDIFQNNTLLPIFVQLPAGMQLIVPFRLPNRKKSFELTYRR